LRTKGLPSAVPPRFAAKLATLLFPETIPAALYRATPCRSNFPKDFFGSQSGDFRKDFPAGVLNLSRPFLSGYLLPTTPEFFITDKMIIAN